MQHTYEGLTRYTKDYKIEPVPGDRAGSRSPTRSGASTCARASSSTTARPFTADDVVFSFGRIQQPQGTNQIYVTGVKEVKKIDDYTVDFILAGPTPILLRNIVDFRIMSKAWSEKNRSQNVQDYAKKEETYASRNTNGTGPYIIKSWEPDKQIVFAANKDWWGKLDGNVTDVVYTPIKSDADARLGAALRRRRPGHRPADAGRRAPAQGRQAEGARRPRGAHHLHRHGPAQRRAQVLERQGQEPVQGRARAPGAQPGGRPRGDQARDHARPVDPGRHHDRAGRARPLQGARRRARSTTSPARRSCSPRRATPTASSSRSTARTTATSTTRRSARRWSAMWAQGRPPRAG